MNAPSEFTQPIDLVIPISEIGESGISRSLVLTQDQKAVLLKELDLVSFENFQCDWQLNHLPRKRYRLKGLITAELTQKSVLSLEPVVTRLKETFATEFWPVEQNNPEISPELDIEYADEIIEFYEDKSFDIGQIIYEQFVVSLEQFPRSEGESFQWEGEQADEDARENPFAVLKKLKDQ